MCPFCPGIGDSRGSYGLGFAPGASADAEKAREAGREAARNALTDGMRLDKPDVLIVNASPGFEEEVLAGISEIVGDGVPVIGGSSADAGTLDGSWWVASAFKGRVDVGSDCVAVTALWPSVFYSPPICVPYMYGKYMQGMHK